MDKFTTKPNILFLSGVSKKDVITIEDHMLTKCCTMAQYSEFNPIHEQPDISIVIDKRCLNCTCIIIDESQSAFIPTFIKENVQNNTLEFGKYGQTCSFNCAVTEIISSTNDGSTERDKFLNNLKILFYLKNGYHISDIKPAPKKNVLKEYGGELTQDQFNAEMVKLNNYKKVAKLNVSFSIENNAKNIFNNISNMIQKNNTPKMIIDMGGDKIVFNNLGIIHSNKRTIRSIYNNKTIVCNSEGEISQISQPIRQVSQVSQSINQSISQPINSGTKLNKIVSIKTNNSIINEFFK